MSETNASVTTINAERFRGTVFFSCTPHKWGASCKVRDPMKYAAYLEQAMAEAKAKAEAEGVKPEEVIANSHIDPALASIVSASLKNGTTKNGKKIKVPTVTKPLLVSDALEALRQHLTEAKTAIVGPFGVAQQSHVREGLYVIANSLVPQVEAQLNTALARLTEEWQDKDGTTKPGFLTAFLADYEAAKERARTAPVLEGGLGPLFSEADYPTAETVAAQFGLDWSYLALGIPEDLPPALKAAASEKFERQMQDAFENVRDGLYTALGGFVDALVERLTVQPGEKAKVFRDSLIENIAAFCEVFDAKNIVHDEKLAELVTKAKTLLEGVTPDKLRQYASVRENTLTQFAAIKTAIDGALTERKGRKFEDLED